jgi:uncharacterized membrane protein YjdF
MISTVIMLGLLANPIAPDKAAHFGVSYAATHTCQVVVKKTFRTTKLISTVACSTAVLSAGAIKEFIDPIVGGKRDSKDFAADLLGVGLAITIISIDF